MGRTILVVTILSGPPTMAGAVDLPNSAGEIPRGELIQLITAGGHLVFASIHHGVPVAGQRPMIRVELTPRHQGRRAPNHHTSDPPL